MRLIAEIGSDSSQLRNDVGSLPGVVKKSFTQMKTESAGGIAENVNGLKKGFRELKELVVAGGIMEGVKRFFDIAIDEANKSTDATDMNAAAVRRFGEAIAEGKESFAKFAVDAVGTFNRVGEGIGTAAKGIGAFFTGTWDKWREGEKTLDETEKGAREQELAFAAVNKQADTFKQLTAEAKQLVEQRAQAEIKSLSLSDQKNVLEAQLLEAQRKQDDAGNDRLKARQAEVEQMKIQNQLADVQRGIDKEIDQQVENHRKNAEASFKVMLDGLPLQERERVIRQDIASIQAIIKSGMLSANDAAAMQNTLSARELQLQETTNKTHEQEVELRKKSALSTEDQIQDETILAKRADLRTDAERETLNIHKLQTQEKRTHIEIEELLEKKVTEGLTPAEQKHLDTLITQDGKLKDQLSEKDKLIAAAAEQAKAEAAVTDEYAKQVDAASKLNSLSGMSVGVTRVGSDYKDQSTLALEGLRAKYQADLDSIGNDGMTQVKNATINGSYADWLSASLARSELGSVNDELTLRNNVVSYAQRYGNDAAVRQYGDDVTNRAFKDMQSTATQTANATNTIAQVLTKVFGQ